MESSEPLERARLSLTGLAIGDAIGGFFEFSQGRLSHFIKNRKLPNGIWHWTDDTQMALSVFSVLRQCATLNQEMFAASLVEHYEASRGYGMTTRAIIQRIRNNKSWRGHSDIIFRGEGSFGNGGASRVPPLGAFFANDLSEAVKQAISSAEVTHAHPESEAGASAVAVAAAMAWNLRAERGISRQVFLKQVISLLPESVVRENLILAYNIGDSLSIRDAASTLGNGEKATVQTTVPFALWCAADFSLGFSDSIWNALEGQGDCDTICAIVGGITAIRVGYEGIPIDWRNSCEPLPQWIFDEETQPLDA